MLEAYPSRFQAHLISAYREKLGLKEERQEDLSLIEAMLGLLQETRMDYTWFFRSLSRYEAGKPESISELRLHELALSRWLKDYDQRLMLEGSEDSSRITRMLKKNPKYVLKNPIASEIISATTPSNVGVLTRWYEVLRNPFDEHPEFEKWAQPLPTHLKNQILSCSS